METHPFSKTAMFEKAHNFVINDGHFYMENPHRTGNPGIAELYKRRVPSAFYNCEERSPHPRCHPGTRVSILTKVREWIENAVDALNSPQAPLITSVSLPHAILWIYGSVGVGKSAIAQTIADECKSKHQLAASFFFSPSHMVQIKHRDIILSIAYQISVSIPRAKAFIDEAVLADLSILEGRIEDQMRELIIKPMKRFLAVEGTWDRWPKIIILDGLDYCQDADLQNRILETFSKAVYPHRSIPFCFLISSRETAGIRLAFMTSRVLKRISRAISIDVLHSSADVERYLRSAFHLLQEWHVKNETIPVYNVGWPPDNIVKLIVTKASGQFLYVDVLLRFLRDPERFPVTQLVSILGHPSPAGHPFEKLDQLYTQILNSSKDARKALRILGGLLVVQSDSMRLPDNIAALLGLEKGEPYATLNTLRSVIQIPSRNESFPIRMFHSSFIEYITSYTRSGKYHVNVKSSHADVAQCCLRIITKYCFGLRRADHQSWTRTPRMAYATKWWAHHCCMSNRREDLFSELKRVIPTWFFAMTRKIDREGPNLPIQVLRLYETQFENLPGVIKWLQNLPNPADVSKDPHKAQVMAALDKIWTSRLGLCTPSECLPLVLGMAMHSKHSPKIMASILKNVSVHEIEWSVKPLWNFVYSSGAYLTCRKFSLGDFLQDSSRSGEYCITEDVHARISSFYVIHVGCTNIAGQCECGFSSDAHVSDMDFHLSRAKQDCLELQACIALALNSSLSTETPFAPCAPNTPFILRRLLEKWLESNLKISLNALQEHVLDLRRERTTKNVSLNFDSISLTSGLDLLHNSFLEHVSQYDPADSAETLVG